MKDSLQSERRGVRYARRAFVAIALFAGGLLFHGSANAANAQSSQRISLRMEQATVEQVISHISQTTNHRFLYRVEDLPATDRRDYDFQRAGVGEVMNTLFGGTALQWSDDNGTIVISRAAQQQPQNRNVTGRVTDEGGQPLAGVAVQVKGIDGLGTATSGDGRFSLSIPSRGRVLVVSYVGMDSKEVPLRDGVNNYEITLSGAVEIEAVTVNAGIIQRDAATYTGSATTLTQEQLNEAGVLNVLSALSILDPSIVIVDNNIMGSDPNSLPNIELNGKTSMDVQSLEDEYSVNPNLPHFVINGFDATLQDFKDIDINRIATLTTLKDAGATAIYGAKGANGVIVIETIKPKSGELMINYNLNTTASFADLSAYNLMNSAEKLEFEKLAGFYNSLQWDWDDPLNNSKYWKRLELIEKGVDTYWLKYPVRTGISHQHNLSVMGGADQLYYSATIGYHKTVGVMKGSDRQVMNGDVFLQYRLENLNVSNQMLFNSTVSHAGSYGSFETWANMSPYFTPYDDEGKLVANVNPETGEANGGGDYVANPLWNASLDSDNISRSANFTNNTKFEYRLRDTGLRFNGGLQLQRTAGNGEDYKNADHTDFHTLVRKGTYSYSNSNSWQWTGNLSATLSRTLGEFHNFTVLARAEAGNTRRWGSSYSVVGLPSGAKPNPSMSNGYQEGSVPGYTDATTRNVTFMGTFLYNYDSRYMVDFTLNRDGSTMYGSERPFTTNWSVGAGWNITREHFAENWTWADMLKLRGSIGTNALQSSDMLSSSVYNYLTGSDYFGQAWQLAEIANPWLDWQKTRKISAGLDVSMLNGRLNASFDVFDNKTDPQTIALPEPPSSGAESFDVNLGSVNSRGYNAVVSYTVLRRPEDRLLLNVRLSAGHTKQEYDGFGESFERLNRELANSIGDVNLNPDPDNTEDDDDNLSLQDALDEIADILNNNYMLNRYRDGNDPDALWSVKSLGIDPSTGLEVFQKLDGSQTFVWDVDDERVIGTKRAKVHGTFGFTFNYKQFRSSFNFQYSYGGYAFNTALYSRVENIIGNGVLNNQDRRALYNRWREPGDVAQFKSIEIISGTTPITSRFIQKNNYIDASAMTVGWDFEGTKFLERTRLKSLLINVSMNNLFRLSTIKMERGIDYPFAREITLSLSTSF